MNKTLRKVIAVTALSLPLSAIPTVDANAALAKINNTWTYATVGTCTYAMKQPFTNVVQWKTNDRGCYKMRLQGWVENNQFWQCRYPTSGGYVTWPTLGNIYSCSVWSVRLGATNANLCMVEFAGYDDTNRFIDGLYIRGGRII